MSQLAPAGANGRYLAHRERQRRRILDAARELFDGRGIDRVTMAEVVTAAGIRASTMYEYFSNKEELVWALVEQAMAQSAESVKEAVEGAEGTALAKIAAIFHAFEYELEHYPARVRFMAQFDAMYAREGPVERLLAIEERIAPEGLRSLAELVKEGIAEGSLRQELDAQLTMPSAMNAVIGAQRRLASLGNRLEQEYGQPVHLLFRETVRITLLGLRRE